MQCPKLGPGMTVLTVNPSSKPKPKPNYNLLGVQGQPINLLLPFLYLASPNSQHHVICKTPVRFCPYAFPISSKPQDPRLGFSLKTLKTNFSLLNFDLKWNNHQPRMPSHKALHPHKTTTASQRRKLPTPQELISHYGSQGLDPQEASIKVIEDLQNALHRVISSGRGRKDKFMAETSRKIDAANSRLAVLHMKMDSKPGYGEAFAIGVASGMTLKGIGRVMPHVFGALRQIWSSVRSATKSSPGMNICC